MINLSQKIKNKRLELNMTQVELAELIGVSNKAVSKWENDEGMPDIENLKKLSQVLNIYIDDLLSNNPNKKDLKLENKLFIMTIILSLILLFIPAVKIKTIPYVQTMTINVSLLNLAFQWLMNFKVLNGLIFFVTTLILINSFYYLFSIYKQIPYTNKPIYKYFALTSAIVLFILIIILRSSTYAKELEVTAVPYFIALLQFGQFILFQVIQRDLS